MIKKFFILILVILVVGGIIGLWFGLRKYNTGQKTVKVVDAPVEVATTTSASEPDSFPNDKDRDGILDEKEKEMGLSNKTFDTDKDGLSDLAEIETFKTDPTKKDTDGDGYNDGSEVMNGYNPAGPGKLDTTKLNQ